jgi:hypothetical protein
VQFLWTHAQQEVTALHFAIALAYYGLMHVPKELFAIEMDVATQNPQGQLCINFARMLQTVCNVMDNRFLSSVIRYFFIQ